MPCSGTWATTTSAAGRATTSWPATSATTRSSAAAAATTSSAARATTPCTAARRSAAVASAGSPARSDALRCDRLHGGDGDRRVNGGTGRDKMSGGTGDDTQYGGAGSDQIFANRGATSRPAATETTTCGRWPRHVTAPGDPVGDTLIGGKGNDRFHVRDGEVDRITAAPAGTACWPTSSTTVDPTTASASRAPGRVGLVENRSSPRRRTEEADARIPRADEDGPGGPCSGPSCASVRAAVAAS